jgi:hypothetical protein
MSTDLEIVEMGGQVEADTTVRNLLVIDFLSKRCKWCGEYIFDSSTKPRKFCDNNNRCCNAYSRSLRNRDRYLSKIDGRYEGPLSGITKRRITGKDHGFHPILLPKDVDVRVKPIEPKFNVVTPADVDWAERQKRVGSGEMPRLRTNWCSQCSNYVAQNHEHKV